MSEQKLADYEPKREVLGFSILGREVVVRQPCAYQTEAIFGLVADVLSQTDDAIKVVSKVWEQVSPLLGQVGDDGPGGDTLQRFAEVIFAIDWRPIISVAKDVLGSRVTEIVGLVLANPENAETFEFSGIVQTPFGVVLAESALDDFKAAARALSPEQQGDVLEVFFRVMPAEQLLGNLQRPLMAIGNAIGGAIKTR